METKTFIVVANVENNTRKMCETIENTTFDSVKDVRNFILENYPDESFSLYEISEFMELINEQEIDNLTNDFISYVQIRY